MKMKIPSVKREMDFPYFSRLPSDIRKIQLLRYLSLPDLLSYFTISREYRDLGQDTRTWRYLFSYRYFEYNGLYPREVYFAVYRWKNTIDITSLQNQATFLLPYLELVEFPFTTVQMVFEDNCIDSDRLTYYFSLPSNYYLAISYRGKLPESILNWLGQPFDYGLDDDLEIKVSTENPKVEDKYKRYSSRISLQVEPNLDRFGSLLKILRRLSTDKIDDSIMKEVNELYSLTHTPGFSVYHQYKNKKDIMYYYL